MIVGITGGIGSGKTFVVKEFLKFSESVYYHADEEAKKLMNTSPEIKTKLIHVFGEKTYKNGVLNRKYLADKVFNNKENLAKLNAIVHPVVKNHFADFIKNNATKDFIIYENAILFEVESDRVCDVIINVTANLEERIKRVQQRDGVSKKEVLERIQNQWSDCKRNLLSNYCIINHEKENTISQIHKIHNFLTKRLY